MIPKRSVLNRGIQLLNRQLRQRSLRTYEDVLSIVLKDFPIEVKNKVLGSLRARDFVGLLDWADSFGSAAQASVGLTRSTSQLISLIKKYPFDSKMLRESATQRAKDKFIAAEKSCNRYNLKFHKLNFGKWDRADDVHNRMSRWIRYVIGEKPDLKRIYSEASFGPGASVGVHGNSTNLARKFLSKEWTCTSSALPYAVSALTHDLHVWELLNPAHEGIVNLDIDIFRKECLNKVRLVQHNKIAFVPKTAKVDRTIAVEPLLNGFLQKGIDNVLRQSLKRVGIDLTDQRKNQDLAFLGSIQEGDPFITIDLSSASDTISTEVVRRLLPPDWFHLLNSVRSHHYTFDDIEYFRYHKFVSMGNGFCFPLETLIFASVCAVYAKPNDFSVYGDDIIVRQSVAHQVIKTLWRLGFRHNTDKTFLEGPFRESCGADWFAGLDTRPLTLDYELDSLQNVIKFFNMSKRKPFWDFRFQQVREYLFDLIPLEFRLCRPYVGVETGAFEVPLDIFQASPFSKWDREIQSWSWLESGVEAVPDKDIIHEERYFTVLMMGAVRGLPSRHPFAKRRETRQTIRRKAYAGATSTWLPLTQ